METTRRDLTQFADELLKLGMETTKGSYTAGGYIAVSKHEKYYTVQHPRSVWHKTKEEAALDWLRWKLRGWI